MIRVSIINIGKNQYHVPTEMLHWGHNTTSMIQLPTKMHNMNLIIRKHYTNWSWKTFYNTSHLHSSKILRSRKIKEGWGAIPYLKTLQKNAISGSRLDPGQGKISIKDILMQLIKIQYGLCIRL